ncbi:MAG: DNA-directed DNA polymerase [Nanoarchaeota archaeon]
MTTIQFMPLDYEGFDFEGKNYIKIVGRTQDRKRCCIIDTCDVYFWAILKENTSVKKIDEIRKKIEKITIKNNNRESHVLKTELRDKKFLGKSVQAIKVYISNHKDAYEISQKIEEREIDKIREYDLTFITRYILERKIKPLQWCEIDGVLLNNSPEYGGVDRSFDFQLCLKAEKIKQISLDAQREYKPKMLAYDIETDEFEIGKGEIVMISLVGENFKKVFSWKKNTKKEYVQHCKNELDMLEKFVHTVKEYDPDILVGYFSDGFDLPYLRARAEKNNYKLTLGLDNSQPNFSRGRLLTAKIKGIIHLDILRFIRVVYAPYLQSETLSLNDVAQELLGERKSEWMHKHSSLITNDEWEKYFEYSLQDSLLTYKIAEKIWPDLLEFSKIVQEPLFDVSRDTMSAHVENFILHNLEKFDEIIEKRPHFNEKDERKNEEKYTGAFVYQPKPGLYDNVVFFDFTSMYGSVIVTYNLSKAALLEKKEPHALAIDIDEKKVYFSKQKSFFADMLNEIILKRKEYKKELQKNPNPIIKARSNAFKLLTNAAYGYLGFFGARYYCREAAASAAALARKSIKETIHYIEKEGYAIVYSDTDSIAFLQGRKTKSDVENLLKKINANLPGIMELDLEEFYKRGIWVNKRNGDTGAKKKYAVIDQNDRMRIRGFETVRRDWCPLARKTQNIILELILKNGNEKKALDYIKEIIKKIKERDVPLTELIIRTQLKKLIEDYRSINPHVTIAQKMKEKGMQITIGMLIEYYIAEMKGSEKEKKKALVREKAKLPTESGKYDIDYYLKNQILPAVENIFEVFNIDVHQLIDGKKQTTLF